jgi:hypothetical protein
MRNGTRTIMAEVGRNTRGHALYRVRCDCGYLSVMPLAQFKNHMACQVCYITHNVKVGHRVGSRIVERYTGAHRGKHREVEVRCDCGRSDKVSVHSFLTTKSCAACAGAGARPIYDVEQGIEYEVGRGRGTVRLLHEDGHIGPHRAVRVECKACGDDRTVGLYALRRGIVGRCPVCPR